MSLKQWRWIAVIFSVAVLDYYWFLQGVKFCSEDLCSLFTPAIIAVSLLSIIYSLVMLYTELIFSGKEPRTGKYPRKQMEKLYERLKNSE